MYVIGLTGGIGSGKSLVANLFAQQSIEIIDADVVAREVVLPLSPALAQIEERYGAEILQADGSLDRKKLRDCVFSDQAELKWLENLLHPLIRARIEQLLAQARSAYTMLVSPLLLETDQHQLVNRILVVDAPEHLQLERASARDQANLEQIKAIMAAQMPRAARLDRADDVLTNDASIAALTPKVQALHQHYLALANARVEPCAQP